MRISIREALLGRDLIKNWVEPSTRFEAYDETGIGSSEKWSKLAKAHPDVFKITSAALAHLDGKRFDWYQMYKDRMFCYPNSHNTTLTREVETYIYDTETESIIFNYTGKPLDELEKFYPQLEEAINSKRNDTMVLKDVL